MLGGRGEFLRGSGMQNEGAHTNFRRPHDGDGDRLRIVRQGPYFSQECVVEGEPTQVTLPGGYVLAYLYKVRVEDGATFDLAEELLAPLPDASLP
jgi:hypothetical protein